MSVWVKVCGNTNLADALLAAEAGADAVGFVFVAASRRLVSMETVAGISAALAMQFPEVERIGVFDSGEAGQVMGVARAAGMTGVQLHGDGGVALARAVRAMAPDLTVIAVVSWEIGNPNAGLLVKTQIENLRRAGVERVLLDSKVGAERGGTGVPFAWEEAARELADVREGTKLVMAGGLRPETVADAMAVLQPWGVDVASGVEEEVRKKSAEKVQEFVAAARSGQAPDEITGA